MTASDAEHDAQCLHLTTGFKQSCSRKGQQQQQPKAFTLTDTESFDRDDILCPDHRVH